MDKWKNLRIVITGDPRTKKSLIAEIVRRELKRKTFALPCVILCAMTPSKPKAKK